MTRAKGLTYLRRPLIVVLVRLEIYDLLHNPFVVTLHVPLVVKWLAVTKEIFNSLLLV